MPFSPLFGGEVFLVKTGYRQKGHPVSNPSTGGPRRGEGCLNVHYPEMAHVFSRARFSARNNKNAKKIVATELLQIPLFAMIF